MPEPTTYEVVIRGRASARLLRPLVDDFAIDHSRDGVTRLVGDVGDAAHLHGILAHLTSVNAEVISIAPVQPVQPVTPTPGAHRHEHDHTTQRDARQAGGGLMGAETMQAILQDEYGPAPEDVLRLGEIPRPEVGDGEVLVRVRATSVDRGTWHLMSGLPYPIRLAGAGFRRPKAANPGLNLAGTVEAVGAGVTELAVGDDVYGTCDGTFAEYASGSPGRLSAKPASLSFEQAAAVPVSGLAALQAVRDEGEVQPGHELLIIGASGGVGSFAVQIAKATGAKVTGVCSTAKVDLVRSLGADHVVDYTRESIADLAGSGRRYDVIIDIGGNTRLSVLRRALTPRGTLVIAGAETDGRWLGGFDRALRAMLLSPFVRQKLGTFISSENSADLADLRDLVDAGKVTPAIERTYPLADVPAAIRRLIDGQAQGKLVITL
jgi:NADPH:quinone reductase-like Zn-dependent oxidoreductase